MPWNPKASIVQSQDASGMYFAGSKRDHNESNRVRKKWRKDSKKLEKRENEERNQAEKRRRRRKRKEKEKR
jgi:hypothetical protein